VTRHDLLEPRDRLRLERLLLWLRLGFLLVAILPLLNFGVRAVPYTALIVVCVVASYAWVWALLRRFPAVLLRWQLVLRIVDCALVFVVLLSYHGFVGDTYYDSVYVFFVVAAAATHGRRGVLLVSVAAATGVLLGRVQLMAGGVLPFEVRHLTDAVYYAFLFYITGSAVVFLMRMSGEAVERREQIWQAVLRQMPAGVIVADASSGRAVLGNEQTEYIFRQPFLPADLGAYPQLHFFRPGGAAYLSEELPLTRSLKSGEVVTSEEIHLVRDDGTRAVLRVSSAPIRDRAGAITAAVVTFFDVTQQQQGEEAARFLAEASLLLDQSLEYETTLASVARLAVSVLGDVCIVDLLGRDGAIRRVAVAHADPAKADLEQDLRQYLPVPGSANPVPEVLRTGRSELRPEVTASRVEALARDAQHLEILRRLGAKSSMNVPLVARGRTLGAITLIAAESGRRYGQADLGLAEELAHRAALAVDNARLYHEAQEAIRVRDEFLALVSHDLKTPLVSVRGFAQLLRTELEAATQPDRARLMTGLAKIDRAATRMTALINELVDVAHVQAGRSLELDRRLTDLVGVAQQVVAELQQTTRRHELRVVAEMARLEGVWDASRLERVVANLVGNAIKYSPGGGMITITVGRENGAECRWAVISVADEGLGIPAGDVPHVFERFHRGENVGQIRGSGLGLASARQIVEQHGGTIDVTSVEGKGSTFTVRLPLPGAGVSGGSDAAVSATV
jgi:signal transduction histidine kinase